MNERFDFRLVRPADLFVAQVSLNNLFVDAARQRLVRLRRGEPASVELELPTQHFAEPSFQGVRLPPVVPLFAGSRTRIEYLAPDGVDEFRFGTGGIVGAFCEWSTNPSTSWLDVLATLWLVPPEYFRITAEPPAAAGPVPLWSTPADISLDRSLFLREFPMAWGLPEGRYGGPPGGGLARVLRPPQRIGGSGGTWRCTKLLLTALGGTVSVEGPDPGFASFPANSHTHRTTLGRTSYARQVVSGHLSSGHAASLVTVATREMASVYVANPASFDPTAGPVPVVETPEELTELGVLIESTILVITEPFVDLAYEAAAHGANAFVGLRITPGERTVQAGDPAAMHWVRDHSGTVMFELDGIDHADRRVPLRMPLAFIPDGTPSQAAVDFVARSAGDQPEPSMATQEVAIAPGQDTSVTVQNVRPTALTGRTVPVVPVVKQMAVVLDQLTAVMDTADAGGLRAQDFRFHDLYTQYGLDEELNPQGALLQIVPPTPGHQLAVPLPTASLGGVANPGLKIGALTTHAGAVALELARHAKPSLADIRAAFPNAKLFGTIDLLALLAESPFAMVESRSGGSASRRRVELPAVARRRTQAGEEFSYTFTANLREGRTGETIVETGARLSLSSTVTRRHDGQVLASVTGSVTGIGITFQDVVTIRFAEVAFRSDTGTTALEIRDPQLTFGGKLELVALLAEKLRMLGQGSGVRVDIDADGVTAGFGLAVPSVEMMAMQFSNLTVDAWLRLPFMGAPMTFKLAIASAERPFLITVSAFGGGGWFALEVSPSGVRRLELGLEFGGSLSLDIIVASGGVTVMAGVYIGWDAECGEVTFEAYLRACGHVSVLGIVSVFVEFILELHYHKEALDKKAPGARKYAILRGAATVKVGIEVLSFSRSVTLTVQRELVGSEADPTFLDCLSRDDWTIFCDAFAPEPAAVGG